MIMRHPRTIFDVTFIVAMT